MRSLLAELGLILVALVIAVITFLLVVVGLYLLVPTPARAQQAPAAWPPADGVRWQVWVKYVDEPTWLPWLSKSGYIARLTYSRESCRLDIQDATLDVPSGTRIRCARLDKNGIHFEDY